MEVDHNHFLMQEVPTLRTMSVDDMPGDDELVAGSDGGLYFHSAANDHEADVRLELWDAEPDPVAAPWTLGATVSTDLRDAVRFNSIFMVFSGRELVLPVSGPYMARVSTRGRDAAAELEEATFAKGVEKWLVQLWSRPA
ncbi:hypothetical protein UO65_0802 [Actinokineospora spheciospongiae]|uniref:Uncharacterized protein n=1 Tax=Actinokineospora spheciospongiae TaxID=909613 RepID=W7J4E6_9PSEU|nr:hypothetical protein UO65_0802 [Actinokineospora spheciospongiae]